MMAHTIAKFFSVLAVSAFLAGCASTGERGGDEGGFSPGGDYDSPADLYVALAAEYYRQGQLDAAIQRAKKGLELDGKNARAHYMIALIYQRIGEYKLAEKHFVDATRLEPKNPDIQNARGTFYCSQKRYREAEEQFKKALDNPLYNTPWVTLTNAGICALQSGDRQKAVSHLRRAIEANPRFGPALQEMADISYQSGDYKGARAYLDRYFQSTQPTARALLLAVRVERRLGARKRAATYEQLLRSSFPDSAEVLSL
jgi:type IV pilus assembly protein PilF